ncbi:hypothetical protein Si141_01334 [Streptococcus infantarius subsp. infantarius]|uniref:hypothetical protein n=1 Tax=Streptococcus infantarius TaxID=102684 RepID=UPI001BD9FBA1|nr:hypothetical protein [Streptococcus infantarius]MBT0932463.1 hypothetical protein [Streptococcus infantarius subsp. infantarius]MCO4469291.1 hypothetical protein [Streptococcus infantarius subsp. infantarius]MCO4592512.1 hypothetical protein [Streptococcus infantarius subsp. infantarius]MCO4637977.1 hypothetical protein [Streptococcus infantarius subsp. infantarius]
MKVKTYSYYDIKTGRRFEGTISEAVEYFNVCKSSLEKWKKSGRLERKVIGSKENDVISNGEKISSPECKRVLNREFLIASFK